ncbi:MAG: S-methyl-5-thioribose-1-phosphate isomerase [Tepidiformaceae bacterium]
MTGEVVALRVRRRQGLDVLDQTLLPGEERYIRLDDVPTLCEAITSLRVRGAPFLGIIGAYGVAIANEAARSLAALSAAAERIVATRPTAADLAWAVRGALAAAHAAPPVARADALWDFADALLASRGAADQTIADAGAGLLAPGTAVLTHCNAGALATGGIGTALGVIRVAHERGLVERCLVTETRPLLQGARLTAWELQRLEIPTTLLPDGAAASLIASGRIGAVVTGADRIAANGDSANKVGTLGLALAAGYAGVPFYVAAPSSTIDPTCAHGGDIAIEFREAGEVGGFAGVRWAPDGLDAYNPAFDVTPATLIGAIITECGVLWPPFAPAIAALPRKR